jgi:hypothetical protein
MLTIRPLQQADAEACDAIIASLPEFFSVAEGSQTASSHSPM